jgi:NADH:ubiquinone oxidoreductase subunit C
LAAPAELALLLEQRGWTVQPPTDHPMLGVTESRWIAPAHLVAAAEAAKGAGYFYESLTCVDRLEAHGAFELVITFARWDAPARVAYRVWTPKDEPVPSLAGVFGIAEWNEREAWELFGVGFSGHPKLRWLLLPDGTEFRPLLKSFTAPPPSIYDDSLTAPAAPQDERTDPRTHG